MLRNNGENAPKKDENSDHKRMINDRLLMLASAIVLLAMTFAWFAGSRAATVKKAQFNVANVAQATFIIYRLEPVGTAAEHDVAIDGVYYSWVTADHIDFTGSVPNQVTRYKVETGIPISSLRFGVTSAGWDSGTAAANEAYELFDYLCFRDVSENDAFTTYTDVGAATAPALAFNAYAAAGNGTFDSGLLTSVTFPCNGAQAVCIFDIYMDKDACPYYGPVSISGTVSAQE